MGSCLFFHLYCVPFKPTLVSDMLTFPPE